MQIAIIDLGTGNLRSVEQALRAVAADANVTITSDVGLIESADKLVLPGQGAIGSWFTELDKRQIRQPLLTALTEKPVLAICVGMQALFESSEEDANVKGLSLVDGQVRHFSQFHSSSSDERISIPQMGWNQIKQTQSHPMWHGIDDSTYFYFLHSYCANSETDNDVFALADYHHQYIAAVSKENLFATQFHPEKSHNDGLQLMRNFSTWNGKR